MRIATRPGRRVILRAACLLVALLIYLPIASPAQQDRQLVQNGSAQSTTANKRIALVIGNGAYASAPPLKNPPNDARDVAAALKALGFDVTSGTNVNQRDMKRMIREFGLKLKGGGSGLFYYAGHGVQSKGRNYLIPVDANIQSEAEVEDSGVDAALVLNFMDDAQNGLNIVILDACRNNPFARSFRSASDGLAQVDAPTGTLIAYATAPGRVASDGTGQNGLYTSELLKQMQVPGVSITDMFMRVRGEVMKQTANKQVPWEASSLVGSFYFSGAPGESSASTSVSKIDPTAFELSYWETIKTSQSADDFKAYLEKYPEGQFARLARNRITTLEPAAKTAEPSSPARGGQAELTFWDSIKNSTSADDYRAYLEKYPNGEFAVLAKRRLVPLEAAEKEKAKTDEIARNTKTFVGRYGRWAATLSYNHPGRLIVTPTRIEFVYDDVEENKFDGKIFDPDVITCADLGEARIESEFVREIRNGNNKYRFMAQSGTDAAAALSAMRYACANPGKNFSGATADKPNEESSVDPTAKIFGGYFGVMSAGFTARPGKLIISPAGIQFNWDKGTAGIAESRSDGLTGSKAVDYKLHPDPPPTLLQCSYFSLAKTDGFFIREINMNDMGALLEVIGTGGAVARFRASSPAEAVSALAAVREICNKRP